MEWVLIRGIVSEEFHWGDFVPLMKKHFKKDLVVTADIIGNGKSFKKTTPLSVAQNIQGLRLQAPGKKPKILVGFSLGGMLALEWAHAYPEEVAGVVLINTSLNDSKFYHRFQWAAWLQLFKASQPKNSAIKEELILSLITDLPNKKIQTLAKEWQARSARYPVRLENLFRQLWLASQISQRQKPPTMPLLILLSEKDKIVHPSCSRKMAAKWKLPMKTHPRAGHDIALEDPQWVLRQLDRWLLRKPLTKKGPSLPLKV